MNMNTSGNHTAIIFSNGVYLVNSLKFSSTKGNYGESIVMLGAPVAQGISNRNVQTQSVPRGTVIRTNQSSGVLLTVTGDASAILTPVRIDDIWFQGPQVNQDGKILSATGDGLVFTRTTGAGCALKLNNVVVTGFGRGTGVTMHYVENSVINNLVVNYNGTGLLLRDATNANVFNYLEAQDNYEYGVVIRDGVLGNSFNGGLIQGNKKSGLTIHSGNANVFTGWYFESNNYTNAPNRHALQINSVDNRAPVDTTSFVGCYFSSPKDTILIDASIFNVSGIEFTNCKQKSSTLTITGTRFSRMKISGLMNLIDPGFFVSTDFWRDWTPRVSGGAGGVVKGRARRNGGRMEIWLQAYGTTVSGTALSIPAFGHMATSYKYPLLVNRLGGPADKEYAFVDAADGLIHIKGLAAGPVNLHLSGFYEVYP